MKRLLLLLPVLLPTVANGADRPRAREVGIEVGVFQPGERNAITDVAGVRVGHVTLASGNDIRTGVTAILPHPGNLYTDRVPAAIHVANGFGKLLGISQVRELGELETPILLTCTLCVWRAADAMVEHLLQQPGMQTVRSINPVVGETNDGFLNAIRNRPIKARHVIEALTAATPGPVAEGNVGAGTGTVAFGFKGGIGTSSRKLPEKLGGHTVGVLVQANFGGILTIAGAPVGKALDQYAFRDDTGDSKDGSIMIIAATDAPLDARLLQRLGKRAMAGLARTGAAMSNGSGDYAIAFSTTGKDQPIVPNDRMSPLFQAVAEATEEAIYNALLKAESSTGQRGTIQALPLERTLEVLSAHGVLEAGR